MKNNINPTDTCFHGDGQSYRGNVSVTQSGYTCQAWTSQCPHRHHRTPDNFPELHNAGNACRNPGGQAPHGPWCYTVDRNQRWEYCRVAKCEEPKPGQGLFIENVSGFRCMCYGYLFNPLVECKRELVRIPSKGNRLQSFLIN